MLAEMAVKLSALLIAFGGDEPNAHGSSNVSQTFKDLKLDSTSARQVWEKVSCLAMRL